MCMGVYEFFFGGGRGGGGPPPKKRGEGVIENVRKM
jgi:hypothetical protein